MRKTHIIDDLLRPWIVVLILLAVAATIALHVVLDENGKKDVDFGAAIISGAGIVYTVLLTIQSKRASSAARFAERWNDVQFTERRLDIGQVIRGEKNITDIDMGHVTAVLNFFEEMSISVQMGEAQELMLTRFFQEPVLQSAVVFTPWIRERQKKSPRAFREYLKLVERWKDNSEGVAGSRGRAQMNPPAH
ncbi:MAG: DUF4760 domain-containing protein [Bryobacteraceae bacterium]